MFCQLLTIINKFLNKKVTFMVMLHAPIVFFCSCGFLFNQEPRDRWRNELPEVNITVGI